MNPDVQGNSEGADEGSGMESGMFSEVASKVVMGITQDQRTHLTSSRRAPHAEEIAELNRRLRWLAFPGFFGPRDIHAMPAENAASKTNTDATTQRQPFREVRWPSGA